MNQHLRTSKPLKFNKQSNFIHYCNELKAFSYLIESSQKVYLNCLIVINVNFGQHHQGNLTPFVRTYSKFPCIRTKNGQFNDDCPTHR